MSHTKFNRHGDLAHGILHPNNEITKKLTGRSRDSDIKQTLFFFIIIIIIIIIIIQYVCLLSQAFLSGTSLVPAVIPTAQASSFTLQYFPYYV